MSEFDRDELVRLRQEENQVRSKHGLEPSLLAPAIQDIERRRQGLRDRYYPPSQEELGQRYDQEERELLAKQGMGPGQTRPSETNARLFELGQKRQRLAQNPKTGQWAVFLDSLKKWITLPSTQ